MRKIIGIYTALVLTLGGCGGGGGGSEQDESARSPQAVVFRVQTPEAVYAIADDGSSGPVELTAGLNFGAIPSFRVAPGTDKISISAQTATDTTNQAYVRNVDGSGLTKVSNLTNPAATVSAGDWKPDGSALVFNADGDTPGVRELYQVDPDGANQLKVNDVLNANENVRSAVWSPDGRYIAFTISGLTAAPVIAIGIYDTLLDTHARVGVSAHIETPRWAPDSSKLAYLRLDESFFGVGTIRPVYQMLTLDPDGSNHVISNGSLGASPTIFLSEYEWSPDSRHIAQLFRLREDSNTGAFAKSFINVYDLTLSNSIRVVNFYVNNNFPLIPTNTMICEQRCRFSWSHQGTELAYLSDHVTQDFLEIFSYNVAGNVSRVINHSINDPRDTYSILGWTSDDRYVVYAGGPSNDIGQVVELADPASTDPALRIGETGNVQRNYTWSPDHRRLFATKLRPNESLVEFRDDSNIDTPRGITATSTSNLDYLFNRVYLSPDEEYVIYETLDVNNAFDLELWSAPLSGGSATKLSDGLNYFTLSGY